MKLPVAFALLLILPGLAPAAGTWIAVVSPGLKEAIVPLAEQRRKEGWNVRLIAAGKDPAATMAEVRAAAKPGEPCCVLLAGDFAEESGNCYVPPGKGTQLRMQGLASDLPWARCVPGVELEVGRLPARTGAEAAIMVRKILAWPESRRTRMAFPAVRLLAGDHGAGGPMKGIADQLTNTLAQRLIGRLPAAWQVEAAVHVDGSPWQISGPDLGQTVHGMMTADGTILAYMGHSAPEAAVSKSASLFSVTDWRALPADGPGPGLFFSCGCYTCELTPRLESYGFAAMRAPGGPPAVIGSHGLSYAAFGYLAVGGLIEKLAAEPAPVRAGTLWLGAQEGLAKGEISSAEFAMLDFADGTGGRVPLDEQRLEHLESWLLLGDPAMPLLPVASGIRIDPPAGPPVAGGSLTVSGTLPGKWSGAALRITLERGPAAIRPDLPDVSGSGEERLMTSRKRRGLSNDVVLAVAEVPTKAGDATFRFSLPLPATLPAEPLTLRVQAACSPAAGAVLTLPEK